MSTTTPYTNKSTIESVEHSKERSLDDLDFERLVQGANRVPNEYQRLQCRFVVHVLGRLGLRAGELGHFRAEWINWREQTIEIPRQQTCRKGRDGGLCCRCQRLAEQMARHNDLPLAECKPLYWKAKTDAAARRVYFGFSARAELAIQQFCDCWDEWPVSIQAVNRRLKRAVEYAEPFANADADALSPHPMRATAATKLAGEGVEASALKQHFGWSHLEVAEVYVGSSSEATRRQLDSIRMR